MTAAGSTRLTGFEPRVDGVSMPATPPSLPHVIDLTAADCPIRLRFNGKLYLITATRNEGLIMTRA